jgi:formylglycine-generating enzyme required for sulfatase activity
VTKIEAMFAMVPEPPEIHHLSSEEFEQRLASLRGALANIVAPEDRCLALRNGLRHPVWQVRSLVVAAAASWMPLPEAAQAILDQTHDSVDVVAFQAIRLCGQLQLRDAIPHLVRISGWPSRFMRPGYLRKPVGIGAAQTKWALTEILGSTDPDVLADREREYLKPYQEVVTALQPPQNLAGMVRIPAGKFWSGTSESADFRFEYRDFIPIAEVDLPEYYIDVLPVTNAQYRRFVEHIEQNNHLTCHPDEPVGKDHWPSHMRDPRFSGDDMPVNGIDWYDAFAYAGWAGKQLPTELQWEKAARGTDGRDYPWGNEWRKGFAQYAETAFGQSIDTLDEWERLLREVDSSYPERPVLNVGSNRESDSPYGVADMAGNVWEWTRTNLFTRQDMDPFFRGRDVLSFTNRQSAFPVIRGGCWTSLTEMLRTSFRGKDLLTDRHFEIGFRCVVENVEGA